MEMSLQVGDYVKITGGTYKGKQGKVKRFAGRVSIEIRLDKSDASVKPRIWNVRKINLQDVPERTKQEQKVTNVVSNEGDEPVTTLLQVAETLKSINGRLTALERKFESLSIVATRKNDN
jgi:ribosomal protein L24